MMRFAELFADFEPELEPEMSGENEWYADEFAPVEDETVDYKQVAEYAKDLRSEVNGLFETIDKKAEWLFGVGLLSIGAVAYMIKEWHLAMNWFAPSLLCSLVSMFLSLRSRMPRTSFLPLSAKAALERAESDPKHFHAWLAASTHVAVTGQNLVCDRKTTLLRWSGLVLVVAALCFSVALLWAPITSTSRPSSPNPSATQ